MYLLRWGEQHLYEGSILDEEEDWLQQLVDQYSDFLNPYELLQDYGNELRGHEYGYGDE